MIAEKANAGRADASRLKVLVAPDKFKHALTAAEAADAIAAGVFAAVPGASVDRVPMADGGEGSGPLLAAALGAAERRATVADALGRRRTARWWLAGRTAVVETAEAAGLQWIDEGDRDVMRAGTFGVGQLMQAALDAGASHILLCVGGSATVDGGAGCLQALGCKLLDERGDAIPSRAGGGDLGRIRRLVPPECECMAAVEVLCDVDNPLLGPRGAAAVFAPQKGANAEQVKALAAGLEQWAAALDVHSGTRQPAERASAPALQSDAPDMAIGRAPYGGAAGGLPAALAAAYGARLVAGVDRIAEVIHLERRLGGCDLCLTGEGRIDAQSAGGKTVAGVARAARLSGVPTVAFTGAADPEAGDSLNALAARLGLERIILINPHGASVRDALPRTRERLTAAVRAAIRERLPSKESRPD